MDIDSLTKKQKQEIYKFFSSITGFSYRGKTYDVSKCNAAEQNVSAGRYSAFSVLYDYQMTKHWEKEFVSKCVDS